MIFKAQVASAQEVFNSYITVNSVTLEDPVWVDFYKQDDPKNALQVQPVLTSLSALLSKALMVNITENLNSEGKITFETLGKIGIDVSVDLNTLDVKFEVQKENKRKSEVRVSRRGRVDNDTIRPDFLSGYLNLRTAHELKGEDRSANAPDDGFTQANTLSTEGVLNVAGVAFETQYIFSDEPVSDERKVSRLYTRFTYDDEKTAVRYSFGDQNHSIRGFQEAVLGAGLGLNKEFTIKPSLFRSSFKKFTFYLDTDATVEIFVNGNLVKRQFLPQGPVELLDFPFNAGENEVTIRTTDALGVVRNLNFSDINDSRLLAKGMSDFNFNLIAPRKNESLRVDFGESYDTDEVLFTGFYHHGLRKNLVGGINLQHSKARSLLGLETLIGNQLGLLKLNLASSREDETDKVGLASRLEHETLLLRKGQLTSFRLFSSAEYRSRDFTNFESDINENKYRLRFSVGQNFRNSIRASLGMAKEWFYTQEKRTYINSTFGWTFYKNFDFSSNVRVNLQNEDDTTVLFSLNWQSRTTNQQFTSTYDPVDNIANTEFVAFPIDGKQNFRSFVGAEKTEGTERGTFGVDYFSQRFEARASHSSAFLERDRSAHNTRFNLGFGLAFTDSSMALTRPVENSFALISMVGRPFGYSVPINRGVNSQRGAINDLGPAAIVNLAPYYADSAKLDITSLPYGYSLSKETFKFKPRYRSGIHINVEIDGEVSVSGRAVFAGGRPAEYVTANLYAYNNGNVGEAIQQIFTGGNGDFNIEKVEKRKYLLRFESEDETFKDIVINVDKKIGVLELKDDIILIKTRNRR